VHLNVGKLCVSYKVDYMIVIRDAQIPIFVKHHHCVTDNSESNV